MNERLEKMPSRDHSSERLSKKVIEKEQKRQGKNREK